jgi:hypothetical protein
MWCLGTAYNAQVHWVREYFSLRQYKQFQSSVLYYSNISEPLNMGFVINKNSN